MGCPNLSVNDYFHFVEDEETDDNGFFFVGGDDYPSGSDGAKQTSNEGLSPCGGDYPSGSDGAKQKPLSGNSRNRVFSWDGENRLISAESNVGILARVKVGFKYDYMGRRVEKKVYSWSGTDWQLSKTEKFVFDGNVPLAVFDGSNNLKESYLYGEDILGSLQATGGIGGLIAVKDASGTYIPAYDGSGNIVAYIDASNSAKVAEIEYDAFGRQIVKSGIKADDFRMRFSTLPYDSELNSTRFLYRDLFHEIGRFPTRDPIGERGGNNPYRITNNDLINRWDLLGLLDIDGWMLEDRDSTLTYRKACYKGTPLNSTQKIAKLAQYLHLYEKEYDKWLYRLEDNGTTKEITDGNYKEGQKFAVPNTFVVWHITGFPQTSKALATRAKGAGYNVVEGDIRNVGEKQFVYGVALFGHVVEDKPDRPRNLVGGLWLSNPTFSFVKEDNIFAPFNVVKSLGHRLSGIAVVGCESVKGSWGKDAVAEPSRVWLTNYPLWGTAEDRKGLEVLPVQGEASGNNLGNWFNANFNK